MTERKGFYKLVVRPTFDILEKTGIFSSEEGHVLVRAGLNRIERSDLALTFLQLLHGIRRKDTEYNSRLHIHFGGGIILKNPVMVGAGWDKHAEAVWALLALGFSAVEIGAVLLRPQEGNPKPRQFMLSSDVALNRLGFNSIWG